MQRHVWLLLVVAMTAAGCARSVNVTQERESLLTVDREWSQTTKDLDKFVTYYAPDASLYAPGMPVVTGVAKIKEEFSKMAAAPGFNLAWTANRAEVSASGDLGYTTGTYEMAMNGGVDKGKFITVWKKQGDGTWKVTEDIINSDSPAPGESTSHVMVQGTGLTWGPTPPALPPGAKLAVVSGDPGKAGPFVIRLQFPAGYRVAPHWHPTTENVTVLAGTLALGMGETMNDGAAQDLPVGGYAVLPAQMRHFAIARTPATVQIHGMGPFVINYVNPADDPSRATQ
jgi:ketosteroid isomerase-like protein/quercetin dioxygenase-like cupin family protein